MQPRAPGNYPAGEFGAEAFQATTAVSRETLERLAAYHALLEKWQPRINLVAPSTLAVAWRRHFLDSAQLLPRLPESTRVVIDLGSGAGFPGLVLAIMGAPGLHLVESDGRKCAFLAEVIRITAAPVTLHHRRIEALPPLAADVVTARALAPLSKLLGHAQPMIGETGLGLFLKGQNVEDELTEATKSWTMSVERYESVSDPAGCLLRIAKLCRR
ncbi:MAG: 16S rRNA (guanine(527)-N(7))-methyltransferase RsmG [Azospirillum sp.]|nr:16S rRNA (guanine(527)-N(7))-methyltransferase RsmG [Azospirillum sp.]